MAASEVWGMIIGVSLLAANIALTIVLYRLHIKENYK